MKEMTLDERKAVLLEIMDAVSEFCENNNLRYYMAGGTLLGAVRHKGFIPWDDDIDIVMPRRDYEFFVSTFNSDKNEKFKVLSENNVKGYYLPFVKVANTHTCLIESVNRPVDLGVNVDIFPIDFIGDDYENAVSVGESIGKYRLLLNMTLLKFGMGRNALRKIAFAFLYVVFLCIPRFYCIKKINAMARKYDNRHESKYVGNLTMMIYGEKEIMESEWYRESVKLEFEGRMYNAPAKYHDVLKRFYNDYMQLPPMEKRVTHHSNKAWWKE